MNIKTIDVWKFKKSVKQVSCLHVLKHYKLKFYLLISTRLVFTTLYFKFSALKVLNME